MKRKLNRDDVPEPINSTFASLNLDPRLVQAVAQQKFTAPTPVQNQTIPAAIAGQNVLARSKTGSGKTVAYLIPLLQAILQRKGAQARAKSTTTALILVPTKELATQVTTALKNLSAFCAQEIRVANITTKEDDAVTRTRLSDLPDIVIATPSRANSWINKQVLKAGDLKQVVIDEADLVLSYGYEEDLQGIAAALSSGVQMILMSATLRTEVESLTSLFCSAGAPTIIDLSEQEATEQSDLSQYIVCTAEDEKFLLIYAIFKLQLIKGKVIIFVADIDRGYRVKLFLEQFGIRSCVLNSELPVNSRLHVVEEFNRGVYNVLIAADENEVIGDEAAKSKKRRLEQDDEEDVDEEDIDEQEEADKIHGKAIEDHDEADKSVEPEKGPKKISKPDSKQRRNVRKDREYGVARGIDFRHVTCVLNFDLPTTSKSYTHRVGRTARAGQKGMALSFYVPKELFRKHKPTSISQCVDDEKILERIKRKQDDKGAKVEEWHFDKEKLSGFRYRLADALRAVTRIAIREARTRELRQELINSAKLQRHFEEHPEDLRHLRHDTESHTVRHQAHLKHVPDYLLPNGGTAAMKKDVGFVGIRKDKENRIRKARAFNKARGKGRLAKGKGFDPLKSLNARGRGRD